MPTTSCNPTNGPSPATGVYEVSPPHGNRSRFQSVREPTSAQLTQMACTIARRVGRLLEREGLLECDSKLGFSEVLAEEDPAQATQALRFRASSKKRSRRVCICAEQSAPVRINSGFRRSRKKPLNENRSARTGPGSRRHAQRLHFSASRPAGKSPLRSRQH